MARAAASYHLLATGTDATMTDRKIAYRGRVIAVEVSQVPLPNGRTARYEIVRHPGGAAVVALNDRDEVCLLRQFRPAGNGWVWELPAGRLEPGEDPQSTALRELLEEAGCEAGQWDSLGSILSSPGVFDETIHLYLARDLTLREIHHEPYEVIEVHWVPLADALQRASDGALRDAKTVIGLLRAASRVSK